MSGAPVPSPEAAGLAAPVEEEELARLEASVQVLEEILGHYHAPRPALLDLAANLFKERLERWVPWVLELANRVVDSPLTLDEARRYYRSDARMWELLQRLRRLDRAWQRWGRRRIYPFLLPARIER